ncbi:hypothetical protein [Streptomyces capuensis]|uniref:hypothetical protein n=1 Tax=Streptomyces capuensis TaxID=1464056 RepID=UPI00067AC650|nr:hypothetical protein [Streptomyces capuensis]
MPTDDEFERLVAGLRASQGAESVDPNPYGAPEQPLSPAQKPGLTKRGKAALGIGAAVIAGSSLIGYQVYSAHAAANEAKAKEIALKSQALELEKLKELNRASEVDRKVTASEEKARQASVDACVKSQSDQVGKGFGSPSYREVVTNCQNQYSATSTTGSDMQSAASQTTATSGGGGVSDGFLIGGGVLLVFVVAAAKKGTRSNPA